MNSLTHLAENGAWHPVNAVVNTTVLRHSCKWMPFAEEIHRQRAEQLRAILMIPYTGQTVMTMISYSKEFRIWNPQKNQESPSEPEQLPP